MAGNTIDAKLRIAAEVAQAIGQLKALRKEILATSGAGGAVDGAGTQARQATSQADREARDQARQRTVAERQARREREAAAADARRQQRQADREAAELQRQQRAAERAANAARVREEQEATRRVRAATNVQAQAYRQLPAQITDITTSIASGMPVWMVAIQQGGQIRDSFGGIGAAARALLGLLTPLRLAVGGVAGVLATLGLGAIAGYREVDRLNKSLALTGNTAATSVGQIGRLAEQLASETRTSIGEVRDTFEALIAAGGQTSTTLQATARAITAYRRLTGATAEEAIKLFDGQASAVLDWATKANKAYGFLTAAQLRYIRELQAQGRNEEAVRLANEELAKTLEQRSAPAIGLIERAWNRVGAAIGAVIDRVKQFGRPETIEDQIAALEKRVQASARIRENLRLRGQPLPEQSPEERQLEDDLAALRRLQASGQIRAAEEAAQRKAEQSEASKDRKDYNDALAQIDLAGVQKRLAQRLAAIDREQDAVDLARSRELISEEERVLKLNALDQQRLEAQAAAVRRQIEIERGRVAEKPEDLLAKQAAVNQLEAQLIGLQSQLQQTTSKGQQALAAEAQEQAAAWEKAWTDAAARIRAAAGENALTSATRLADPLARARAEAAAQLEQERRDLAQQQRALRLRIDLTVNPEQARELQRQLDQLTQEGGTALQERTRQAVFASLKTQLDEQVESLRIAEQEIAQLEDRAAITTEEAEGRKLAARAAAAEQLQRIVQLLRETAAEGNAAEQNAARGAGATVSGLVNLTTELQRTARAAGISELAQGLTAIQTGAKSAGDALRDMVGGFARAVLNVLNQRLAEKLVDSFLKMAERASGADGGGGVGGLLSALGNWVVSLFHTGGVVGSGMQRMSRAVAPALLAGAQVLHTGGLVSGMGLKSNERAAVLEVGEEVLTTDNPRHVNNFKSGGLSVQSSYTFNGSGGNAQDQRAAAEELDRRMRGVVQQFIAEQQRQGGIFSGVSRG